MKLKSSEVENVYTLCQIYSGQYVSNFIRTAAEFDRRYENKTCNLL